MTRPRGFAPYDPTDAVQSVIKDAQAVLTEYRLLWPLTIRQIFYRLVATTGYEKTQSAYKRLIETLVRARRAKMIPMMAIRDDGFHLSPKWWFDGLDDFAEFLTGHAEQYTCDRMEGQDRRIQLWCESAGMVPQLAKVARPYCIRVASSGGFDSLTCKHDTAREMSWEPTLVLHLGDYDPSGLHMFSSLDEDVKAFCLSYGGDVEFKRIAVTESQIDEFGLPSAPPKMSDRRSFDDDRTVQCESLDPETLAGIVQSEIEANLDLEIYAQALNDEEETREEIKAKLRESELWRGD